MIYQLPLYAEILLLALRDKEGTISPFIQYQFALGGAILAELLLQSKIVLDDPKRKKISLKDSTPTGDDILDECLLKIQNSKRQARAETWIQRFAHIKKLKHRIAGKLCQQGILKEDEDKVLLIFSRKIYPEINPEPEQRLINTIQTAVYSTNNDVDARIVVLLSLIKSTNMLNSVLDKADQKKYKLRIDQIIKGEVIGQAAKEAIEAVQAAVVVACIVPVIASSAAH